ncbi:MAG: MATE family efflux transporter, partial [Eubacteriales bacterium]|nr:MATE family efflux transporter [Eubacteriales bacterium]
LFGTQLLSIYNSDPEVIRMGLIRLQIICATYFLCGNMDVMVGQLRGIGYSVMPMIVSLAGACGLRIVWIYTIFQTYHTLDMLIYSYPVSWLLTALIHVGCYAVIQRKLPREDLPGPNEQTA